jgi:hypothetical protein
VTQEDVGDSNDRSWDGGFANDDDMMNMFENQPPLSSTTVPLTTFDGLTNLTIIRIGKYKV